MAAPRKKLIIDTDPGIDDGMAILSAFNSPELDIIGLTTIFGNVWTETATLNAFKLLDVASQAQVPVAEGSHVTFAGLAKTWVPDFVHGLDGFGNMAYPPIQGVKHELDAADFMADTARRHPGTVTVLALGPLTNVALAMQRHPDFARNVGEVVVLGGAFFINGNVNPAAEANMFGDPEAADFALGQGAVIKIVGLDVTHSCLFTGAQLALLAGRGRFGSFLAAITGFYLQYHRESYDMDAVYVHDPCALAAVLRPDLFVWQPGQVRVLTESVARGMSVMDRGLKRWNNPHAWTERPLVQVAIAVNAVEVITMLLERMAA